MGTTVYSIGHSTHPIGRLIELLRLHEIETVADVRSKPFSRRQPQFNRELKPDLFAGESDLDAEAYRRLSGRMGYKS